MATRHLRCFCVSKGRQQATASAYTDAPELELHGLGLKELRRRAKAAGVAEDALEDTIDADDPKAPVISLLLETLPEGRAQEGGARADLQQLRLQKDTDRSESVDEDRPHFGSAPAAVSAPIPAPAPTIPTKHVMLSYQWDHQAQVMRVYDMLTRLGITGWT